MSPYWLEEAIKDRMVKGKKPKAIIPVHLYGMPANMPAIMEIANSYEIPVLEDAAEALGSSLNGKMCGTFGQLAALSFNGNKIITTSGGGALVGGNAEQIERARFLATQARDAAPHYQHSQIGYNYRMSNITAGIGRGQMEVLQERVAQRRKVYAFYEGYFKGKEGVTLLAEPEGYFSNRWLSTILLNPEAGVDREILRLAFEQENIETRPLWKPMHMQPVFEGCPFYGDNTSETLFERGLCLPSGSNLTEAEMERINAVLDNVFEKACAM
jgi:dTDP-4-amino-4,6-dideoxygalactose transaminase